MRKLVDITIDVKIARNMLRCAGFNYDEIRNATDDEIFEKTLTLHDCYGMTYKLPAEAAPAEIIETIENGRSKRVFSCCGKDRTQMTAWMIPGFCPDCGAKLNPKVRQAWKKEG